MLPESLYSYLNLESTKTYVGGGNSSSRLYSYLNLESTKTVIERDHEVKEVVQLLKS